MVERLFLAVPRVCLQFVIVVFPDHTHLLFLGHSDHKCVPSSTKTATRGHSACLCKENAIVLELPIATSIGNILHKDFLKVN